jgi:hypothetical protein
LEKLGVDGRIILKLIFKNNMTRGLPLAGSAQGYVACSCKYGNETLNSTNCGDLLDKLRVTTQKDSAP